MYIYIHIYTFPSRSLSLAETAYPIMNMFQVNKKEARITFSRLFWLLMAKFR